jgi:peptide/nickel transport system substrate-binding protein
MAGQGPIMGHTKEGRTGMGGFAPAHYLKQFHPRYVSTEELEKRVKDDKFDSWVSMFKFKNDWARNPDLPVITHWRTVTPITTSTSAKVPVILENQQRGGYKLYLDPGDYGGDMIIKFNLSYEADLEIAKWMNTADFHRALALGIDRAQVNETFWLGTGTPSSVVPADHNKYNPGPEYRTLWATYAAQKANEMLDTIGLDKKDEEGYRLRSDGKGRLRIEITTLGGQFLQFTQIAEMIRDQWKKIGIDLIVQEVERSLAIKRGAANEQQLSAWNNDGSEHLFTFPTHVFPYQVDTLASSGPLYARWFRSAGTQGKEPPAYMRELMDKFKRAFGVPEEERIKLGKEIWKTAAESVSPWNGGGRSLRSLATACGRGGGMGGGRSGCGFGKHRQRTASTPGQRPPETLSHPERLLEAHGRPRARRRRRQL